MKNEQQVNERGLRFNVGGVSSSLFMLLWGNFFYGADTNLVLKCTF